MNQNLTDLELIERSARGELEAFSQLVDRHQQTLMNFLWSMGVIPHELDDLSQEVWMKIYDYRHRYQEQAKFTTFLYMVAKQKMIDRQRKRKRWQTLLQLFRKQQEHLEEQHERHQLNLALTQDIDVEPWLARLSENLREVVVLKHMENMSLKDIAELLQLPLGTVKSRLHTAMSQLKEAT